MKLLSASLRPGFLLAAVCALFLAGCASAPQPKAYNVQITLDAPLQGSSVQIDLVGVNDTSDLPKWQTYSVTEYWQPGNPFRRDARKSTIEFGRGKPNTQGLLSTDPRWAEWLRTGALHLVIVADLPGAVTDQAGNADPRRVILPLDRAAWNSKTATLEVLVQESGLRLMTPRKL